MDYCLVLMVYLLFYSSPYMFLSFPFLFFLFFSFPSPFSFFPPSRFFPFFPTPYVLFLTLSIFTNSCSAFGKVTQQKMICYMRCVNAFFIDITIFFVNMTDFSCHFNQKDTLRITNECLCVILTHYFLLCNNYLII